MTERLRGNYLWFGIYLLVAIWDVEQDYYFDCAYTMNNQNNMFNNIRTDLRSDLVVPSILM